MKAIIALFLTFLMVACTTDGKTEKYLRLVEEWQGRTIEFPSVMVDVVTGDTIDISDADFTLVTYVDSAGCTVCNMRLSLWTMFINSLDDMPGDYEIVPLIVVKANDDKDLSDLVRQEAYCYPVINDKSDSLNTLNNFSEYESFRSLLLDRNHRVIAIGNPAISNSVADFYRSLISGSKTFDRSGTQGIIATPAMVELGEVPVGQERSVEFTIKNQGNETVYIQDIITSCHCTTASVTDTVIPPGATIPVYVVLRDDTVSGQFQRSVHIFYRDFDNPTVLHISGTAN